MVVVGGLAVLANKLIVREQARDRSRESNDDTTSGIAESAD